MTVDTIKIDKHYKPIILIILDGWGLSPSWGGNAIAMNNPPNINSFWRHYPHKILQAFQPIAGETGNVANSEIGHASIGTGRMIDQDLNDINRTIRDGSFYRNPVLLEACQKVKENKSNLHLIGLVSDGGIHAHIKHLFALLELARKEKVKKVFIHVITDGRDSEATSAIKYLTDLEDKIKELGIGQIATISGRYYAMDRNQHWQRISLAYKAQVTGEGRKENDPLKAISSLYCDGFTDEFIPPTVISKNHKPLTKVQNKDSVIFFNFRADRARQLTQAYLNPKIYKSLLGRKLPLLKIHFITLTDYKLNLPNFDIVFPSVKIESNLSKILSDHGLKQVHIAESEKYAHVTYFFNGGQETAYANEERIIIPSANIPSYDQKPEMSADQISQKVIQTIKSKKYDFILINFANVDMVGHTGNILATTKAVEVVDKNVAKIVKESLKTNGLVILTADHGNAEQMITVQKKKQDPETLHSLNPVPFILIAKEFRKNLWQSASVPNELPLSEILATRNTLADITPTILNLLNISKPTGMTGYSLLKELE